MINERFICIDCGAQAPLIDDADGGSTLISMKYGWRITRRINERGEGVVEPRCPACYARKKAAAKVG